MGFDYTWRYWVLGYLINVMASILVNRSPMDEFEIFRGLIQGDMLSRFLLISVIVGLHSLIYKAQCIGLFHAVFVGHSTMVVSYFFHVDDVIFLGEWSHRNSFNLVCLLIYFFPLCQG